MSVHLIKLCVGVDTVEELVHWQAMRRDQYAKAGREPVNVHVTRNFPRRAADVLDGGSLFWVIKGVTRVRQRILRLDELRGEDGGRRCGIVLDAELVRTDPRPPRAFQGWRYLEPREAPADLPGGADDLDDMPARMRAELRSLGLI